MDLKTSLTKVPDRQGYEHGDDGEYDRQTIFAFAFLAHAIGYFPLKPYKAAIRVTVISNASRTPG